MQVAGYVRVSSRSQARVQTIGQQIDRLRTHAAAQGWDLAQEWIFRDDGYSGANLRRPGLDRLRDLRGGHTFEPHVNTGDDDRITVDHVRPPDQALGRKDRQGGERQQDP